jgi:CubicO group peptidase (beta-lactamase class C family)
MKVRSHFKNGAKVVRNKILLIIFLALSFNTILAQDFTKVAKDIMVRDSIPEMIFAVITKDSILIQNALGHHKITELNEKPNASINDFFHLGSNTKAITGFLAACLVEKDLIKWDTRFFDLFPELKNKSNPEYYNITLENLLTHRARIHPYTSGEENRKNPEFAGNKQERRAKFAEFVLTLPPVENNENFNYSNAGYSIAAVMLEKVSGKSWEELCTEILKEKLMIDFAFGWPNRNYENQPFGHWNDNGIIVPIPPETEYDLSLIEPGGDLSMNIGNFIKFIQPVNNFERMQIQFSVAVNYFTAV